MLEPDHRDLTFAAKEGMAPFVAKDIIIFEEFDIDFNQYRLGVEWRTETHVFPFNVKFYPEVMLSNPWDEFLRIANKILQYYRFEIPTIPMYIDGVQTHPHILLGEN